MTRDELEATVWKALREMRSCRTKGKCHLCNARVNDILKAADAYGLAEYGIAAERRQAIGASQATILRDMRADVPRDPEKVHFGDRHPACGADALDPALTTDTGAVTCGRCKRTGHYRTAAPGIWDALKVTS